MGIGLRDSEGKTSSLPPYPYWVLNVLAKPMSDKGLRIIVTDNPDGFAPGPGTFIDGSFDRQIVWSNRHHGIAPL